MHASTQPDRWWLLKRPHIRAQLAQEPVVFEGVAGAPRLKLGGASGAQSAVLPCVDAFLGVEHNGPFEMDEWSVAKGTLAHLPPPHRALLRRLRGLGAPGSAAAVERRLVELRAASAPRRTVPTYSPTCARLSTDQG